LFETTHFNEALRIFWEEHFAENIQNLNNDQENKGLTFKILYFLAQKKREGYVQPQKRIC
jgi:hypothetical protein